MIECVYILLFGENVMENKKIPYKIYLEENEMPRAWYNLRADMKDKPAPLLHPETHKVMTGEDRKSNSSLFLVVTLFNASFVVAYIQLLPCFCNCTN